MAELATIDGQLAPDLGGASPRAHRHPHEPRVARLLPLPDEDHRLGRVEALLEQVEQTRVQLALGQTAEEVPREVRKLLEELGERTLVLFELPPAALELFELAFKSVGTLAPFTGRRAEPDEEGDQQPGGDDQAKQERNECTRHGVFPS